MSEVTMPSVEQLLLKLVDGAAVLDEHGQLTADFLLELQGRLVDSLAHEVSLNYVRPIGLGLHVLGVQPRQSFDVVQQLCVVLAAHDNIDFVEPDSPR